jgi:SAM-dependent methyltransferase
MIQQTQSTHMDARARAFNTDDRLQAMVAAMLEARGKHFFFARAIDDYIDALALHPHAVVLDLGCGTGVVARAIARRSEVKRLITAIDASPYLVEAGKRIASAERVSDRIRFLTGDPEWIIGPERRFDVVILHMLMNHVADPGVVLREVRRVLRPGGRVVVFDGDADSLAYGADAPDSVAQAHRLWAMNRPVQGRVMRAMPGLLADHGFRLEWSRAYIAADIGGAALWRPESEPLGSPPAADNRFLASCDFYTNIASRND